MTTGLGFLLLRLAIDRRLRKRGELPKADAAEQRKHLVSIALYMLAMPLAFYHPRVALADLAVVTLIWIQPTASHGTSNTPGSQEPS